MADKMTIGGYPIVGTPTDGDWLWFTGAEWNPIPYGTSGNIVALVTPPPKPVIPFSSNGYVVMVKNLKPGQVLAAVFNYIPILDVYHEYITNIFIPHFKLGATDIKQIYAAYPGLFTQSQDNPKTYANKLSRTFFTDATTSDGARSINQTASKLTKNYSVSVT